MEPKINWNEYSINIKTACDGNKEYYWSRNWNKVPEHIKIVIQQHLNDTWKNPQNNHDMFQILQNCETWEWMTDDRNKFLTNINGHNIILKGGYTFVQDDDRISKIYIKMLGTDISYQRLLSQLYELRNSGQPQTELNRLRNENERLKQALEMIMTQSQTEFDLTAQIIGYTRTKQILGEMFIEQRQHLSNQLQELSQLGQPHGRSFPIENNINKAIQRIRQRLQESELEEFVDTSTRITEPIKLNLENQTTEDIYKQFFS